MKHYLTMEEEDLLDFVTKFLSLHGVKPKNDVQFLDVEGEPVTGLHIEIDCEMAELPDTCPLCHTGGTYSMGASTKSSSSNGAGSDGTIVERSGAETAPSEETTSDDDTDDSLMSMASLQAMSKRLETERAREVPQTRSYMAGESDTPPRPGEGL